MLNITDKKAKTILKSNDGKQFRLYTIENKIGLRHYPSVTSILGIKHDFTDWKKIEKNAEEIILYGTTVGVMAHYRLQSSLANQWNVMCPILELSREQKSALQNWYDGFPYHTSKKEIGIKDALEKISLLFYDWIYDHSPQLPIEFTPLKKQTEANINPFEIDIWSDTWCYAGAVDLVTYIPKLSQKGNVMVDLKSKADSGLDHNYKLQLTAYYLAFKERYPDIPIDETRILYIPKDGENWKYSFSEFDIERKDLSHEWYQSVKNFYDKYGDIEPLTQYKKIVIENLKKEGF